MVETKCMIDGCERTVDCRGLCRACYYKMRKQNRLNEFPRLRRERVHILITFSLEDRVGKCQNCGEVEIGIRSISNKQYPECLIGRNENKQRWAEENPGRSIELTRKATLQRIFKITPEQYNQMLENQNGSCGICGALPDDNKRLAVDHNRNCCSGRKSCGECVRGLLCMPCNTGLGRIENYIDIAVKWITNKNII